MPMKSLMMRPEEEEITRNFDSKTVQENLPFALPAAPPNRSPQSVENGFCPVYYPKTGEGLINLALRLAPILQKTGWEVQIVSAEEGDYLELCDSKGERESRRLSDDEQLVWQVVLNQLGGASGFPDLA
jgi:hypothetical protein